MNAHTKQQQDKVFETDFIDSQKSDPPICAPFGTKSVKIQWVAVSGTDELPSADTVKIQWLAVSGTDELPYADTVKIQWLAVSSTDELPCADTVKIQWLAVSSTCLLYTSPSPRDFG